MLRSQRRNEDHRGLAQKPASYPAQRGSPNKTLGVIMNQLVPARASTSNLPALVATSGEQAARRFLEFFASNIRNRNTRIAYSHAVGLFLTWCEEYGVPSLGDVQPPRRRLARAAGAHGLGPHREAAARRNPSSV